MGTPYLRSLLRLYRHYRGSRAWLREHQEAQLRRILQWSADRAPFYRERFRDCGLDPSLPGGPADLARLPLTERSDLQIQAERLRARGLKSAKCKAYATSGSTGEPVKVWFSQEEEAVRGALSVRNRMIAGAFPFWSILCLSGSIANRTISRYQRLGIYPIRRLSAATPPGELARAYRQYRPRMLTGYASGLQRLGEALERTGQPFPKPRLIMPGGELLPANTRAALGGIFGAPVRDLYGTEELGYLAWECPRGGGYHLNADCFFFEVLQDGRPAPAGVAGELVVTSLYMRSMPLIRYRVGDRVVPEPEPCSCGCAFPRLKVIEGRLDDALLLPSGEKVHAVLAVDAVKPLKEVRRFQIIQEEDGRIRVNLAAQPFLNPEQVRELRLYFQRHFQGAAVEVHQAREIVVDPAIKWKPVICRKRA